MRKVYGMSSLDLNSLDASEFFQLLSDSREAVAIFAKANKSELIYTTKVVRMAELLEAFQGELHTVKKSKSASKLAEVDQARDDALLTLKSMVQAFSRIKTPAIETAYASLSQLFKSYIRIEHQSYEKESEAITHLLKQLKTETYPSAIETLHLSEHVARLEKAQADFTKAYQARLAEQTSAKLSRQRELRQELRELYDFLLDFTAINAYAYPEKTAFVHLRDQLNALRRRYKKPVTKKEKKEEAKEA